jgi:hypothetical protein
MRRNWAFRGLRFVVFAAAAVAIVGLAVMGLWNWLAPALFGWHAIGFAQAIGLLVLSRILFGGLRGHWGHRMQWQWRQRMMERWESMTPEEREKFRSGMRMRCGGAAAE